MEAIGKGAAEPPLIRTIIRKASDDDDDDNDDDDDESTSIRTQNRKLKVSFLKCFHVGIS